MYGTRAKVVADGQPASISDVLDSIRQLEKSFTDKLEAIEDRINVSIQQAIRNEIDQVKADLSERLKQLEDRVSMWEDKLTNSNEDKYKLDRNLNVIIHNLPETNEENLINKVGGLFKDTLKLQNIGIEKAERKRGHAGNKPGVIVTTLNCREDKEQVMQFKHRLKNSIQFKNVYIDHDKSLEQRRNEANLRLLVTTVAKDSLFVQCSRVVHKERNLVRNQANQPERD